MIRHEPSGRSGPAAVADSGSRASDARYLIELDAVRGIAILLVVLFHSRLPVPLALIDEGHTGVSLFFVLSAFLLSLPFFKHGAGWRFDVVEFYRRRALRILPLYWGVIAIGAFATAAAWHDLLRAVPFLVFANGVRPVPQISPYTDVTWSLATEVQFYGLLPLLPWLRGTPGRRRIGWVLLLCAGAVYAAMVSRMLLGPFLGPNGWMVSSTIVGRGPVFLLGILGAWLYARFADALRASKVIALVGDAALVGCFVLLELLLRWIDRIGYLTGEFPPQLAWHVAEGALWTAVVLLVLVSPLRLRSLIVNRFLVWLGLISYSVYLLHWPVFHYSRLLFRVPAIVEITPFGIAWLAGTLLITLALASLSYRFIELPFLRRKGAPGASVHRHLSQSPAPPPPRPEDASDSFCMSVTAPGARPRSRGCWWVQP